MNQKELIAKLQQIEEQARLTLDEFPKNLTKERQRMIIALAKYIRSELDEPTIPEASLSSVRAGSPRGH
jgi:hypothetical protein